MSQLSVKVELQTKSQKLPLQLISKHGDYVAEFQYDQTYDAIIHHAVKELGLHVYVFQLRLLFVLDSLTHSQI